MEEEILTIQEAATYLSVSPRSIWKWVADGTLGCYRIGDGRSIRIGTTHLQEYLKKHEETANEPERSEEES